MRCAGKQVASRAQKHKGTVFNMLQDLDSRVLGPGEDRHRRVPPVHDSQMTYGKPTLATELAWVQRNVTAQASSSTNVRKVSHFVWNCAHIHMHEHFAFVMYFAWNFTNQIHTCFESSCSDHARVCSPHPSRCRGGRSGSGSRSRHLLVLSFCLGFVLLCCHFLIFPLIDMNVWP
jgi:hypothetical protein